MDISGDHSDTHLKEVPNPRTNRHKLVQMLNVDLPKSVTFFYTEKQSRAEENAANHSAMLYRKIGVGACGAIFAADGQTLAYKIGKIGAGDDNGAVWTDFQMHQRISDVLRTSKVDIEIPTCHFYVNHDDQEWWDGHQDLAAVARDICHIPARVLVTGRILPLAATIRHELIQRFCKEGLRKSALADPANDDCLVRVYLGSMRGRVTSFFSLRNFKLHLNQMIEIGMDGHAIAISMGRALALMHWKARTDANDVEFALGTSAARQDRSLQTRLFILDFNQVRDITMDDAGIKLAIDAFLLNDPYYPRPGGESREQRELWDAFVHSYLEEAEKVLGPDKDALVLPRRFIEGIIDRVSEKASRR